jgi:type VI secretion system protein VasD
MAASSKRVRWMFLASLALVLASCGGAPPKPAISKATLVAAADANPDSGGRASPVVVRLYQLKEEGAFSNADFFALYDNEQATLGPSLVAREEYELKPGESRDLELQLAPETRFVAAIAAFRDIRNAQWRAVAAAPPAEDADKYTVKLGVQRTQLQLSVNK